jgi:hypothetical protein
VLDTIKIINNKYDILKLLCDFILLLCVCVCVCVCMEESKLQFKNIVKSVRDFQQKNNYL